MGKPREALPWLERALKQRGDDHDSFDTAEIELSLSRALVATHGDKRRARQLADHARTAYRAQGSADADDWLQHAFH